jgi:cytochrome b6-f complex iron-sulfur subunit
MFAISSAAIVGIAIAAIVVLAVVVLLVTARRTDVRGAGALSGETLSRDRAARKAAPLVAATATGKEVELAASRTATATLEPAEDLSLALWTPPDPEQIAVSRRQFLNRTAVTLMSVSLAGFGAAVLAFLWPSGKGGFGGKVPVGTLDDIFARIEQGSGFGYFPEARAWITTYPSSALPKAREVYPQPVLNGMEAGIAVLWQKCPHLGCRVPQCVSSQWFECPCHGSQYNQAGEKKAGPAPRGMDRFGVEINGQNVVINTGLQINGPAIGVNTTGQEAEGPHCISGEGGGH